MHGVVVIPAPAPDEALGFKGIHDGLRKAVAPAQGPVPLPTPIVALRGIQIDRDAKGVGADAIRARDLSLREPA